MFDKIKVLKCSKSELEELFTTELKGECLGVILDKKVIDVIVYYKNNDDFQIDTNTLGLNLNLFSLQEYKENILTDNDNFKPSKTVENGFTVTYSMNDIKTFLNKKAYGQLADDLNFYLNDLKTEVTFGMVNYDPIPAF